MTTLHVFPDYRGVESEMARVPVEIGFIGQSAVLYADDDKAEFVTAWKDAAIEGGKVIGRMELVADLRKKGKLPDGKRLGGPRFAGRCSYCLQQSDALERDHIVPFSKGGNETPDNLTPICRTCNSKKKDRSLLTFVAVGGIS